MFVNIVYTCPYCHHDFYYGFLHKFEGYCRNPKCEKLISLNGAAGKEILQRKFERPYGRDKLTVSEMSSTRKEAIELGHKYYFTGLPCRYGHMSPRTARSECVTCILLYQKDYTVKHSAQIKIRAKKFRDSQRKGR